MDELVLVSKEYFLTLVVESEWQCHVYYSDGRHYKNHYLGVASVDYVCSYLISGISKCSMVGEVTFKRENCEVFWIMSLFTAHASLYGNVSGEDLKLFCQEDGGRDLPTIILNQQCINDWMTQLSELQMRYQSDF